MLAKIKGQKKKYRVTMRPQNTAVEDQETPNNKGGNGEERTTRLDSVGLHQAQLEGCFGWGGYPMMSRSPPWSPLHKNHRSVRSIITASEVVS